MPMKTLALDKAAHAIHRTTQTIPQSGGFLKKSGTAVFAVPFQVYGIADDLDHNNVFCLQPFLALHNSELYALAFFQVAVTTVIGKGAEMHEHVRTFRALNETETFAAIEPFDRTLFSFR